MIPLLSYVFDYFTRIYTDLLSSGNQAAVEFMPFVCSLAYLVFVLQTTQEQKLRSQLEQTQNSLNLQVAQAVREIDALRESQRKASTYRHDLRHHLGIVATLVRAGEDEQALAALMRLCARAEKSQEDARRLMRGWGLAERDAEGVLAKLVRDRFIDDARYAGAFVREKLRLSGWGGYKIRTALQRKRIDRALIDAALAEADRSGMDERLRRQLERKARTAKYSTQYELKTKLIRYGLSLGYDYETVVEAASGLVTDTETCDEF